MGDKEQQQAAVYLGWTTFQNTIMNGFGQGLPSVIDKSLFPGQSGSAQGQIMAGIKFLGLIDDKGKPTADLRDIVEPDEEKRKRAMGRILKERYADVFAIDIEKATMAQLYDTMQAKYGVSGDTREKAVRFFLAACKFAEIPVSPYLAKGNVPVRRKASTGAARKARTDQGSISDDDGDNPPAIEGVSQSVTLTGGGKVTLTVSVNVFQLKLKEDRDFVFGLIEKLDAYEKATTPAGGWDANGRKST